MFEFEHDYYSLNESLMKNALQQHRETREEVLTEAFDVYLQHQHGCTLGCLLDLQSRMHNVKLKHFFAHEYIQDKKTHYTFKGELIFTIYSDNMQWKCETYY